MSGQLIGDLLSVGGKAQEERDRLASQLSESERLRTDAFRACEIHRLEYEKLRLERDEWKAAVEYQQQQAMQLRQHVEALEASVEQEQVERDRLQVQLQEKELQRKKAAELCESMRLERDECEAEATYAQRQVAALESSLQQEQAGRDRLQVQLQEKELQRTAVTLERNHWIAGAGHAQENVRQLRLQVAALESSLEQEQGINKTLLQQLADADAQIRQFEQIQDTRDELEHQNKQLQAQLEAAKSEASKTGLVVVGSHLPNREQLDAEIVRLTNNWSREIDERKALQQQAAALKASVEHEQSANRVLAGEVVKLQTQLDAAAVTPAQQMNGDLWRAQLQMKDLTTARDAAFKEIRELRQQRDELQAQIDAAAVTPAQQPEPTERLERVRRLIGEICGWYACIEYFDEIKWAEAWEQVGALLGHLQREAN